MAKIVVTSVIEVAVQRRLFAPMQAMVRDTMATRVEHTDESSCGLRDRDAAKGCFSYPMGSDFVTAQFDHVPTRISLAQCLDRESYVRLNAVTRTRPANRSLLAMSGFGFAVGGSGYDKEDRDTKIRNALFQQ